MGKIIDKLLQRLVRSGLRRGIGAGGWPWLALAGSAYLLRRVRRPRAATAKFEVRPGERYLVQAIEPGSDASG